MAPATPVLARSRVYLVSMKRVNPRLRRHHDGFLVLLIFLFTHATGHVFSADIQHGQQHPSAAGGTFAMQRPPHGIVVSPTLVPPPGGELSRPAGGVCVCVCEHVLVLMHGMSLGGLGHPLLEEVGVHH